MTRKPFGAILWILVCALGAWQAASTTSLAEEPKDAKAGQSKSGDEQQDEQAASNDPVGPRIKAKTARVNSLRKMTEERLDLSPAQTSAIRQLFNQYIADLKANVEMRRDKRQPDRPNTVLPPNRAQLEKQLEAARKAKDTKKVDEIQAQIDELMRSVQLPQDEHATVLVEKIKEHLKPDQVAKFDKVVERWKAISPRGPRTGPFQQLRRALADPELNLSEEQKSANEEILREALANIRGAGATRTPEKVEEVVQQAKAKILEKLSQEQKSIVLANIRTFQAEEANYDDSRERAREGKNKTAGPADDEK